MFEILIAFTLLIIGLVTGYALRPRIDRKISYKKRGRATKQRAAAKRAKETIGNLTGATLIPPENIPGHPDYKGPHKDIYPTASATYRN